MELITTAEAAERLGVVRSRVLALIAEGRLPATKLGRDWVIQAEDLARVAPGESGFFRGDREPPRPRANELTMEQAAEALGIKVNGVRYLVSAGKLEGVRRGRRVYVTRPSLDAELARRGSQGGG